MVSKKEIEELTQIEFKRLAAQYEEYIDDMLKKGYRTLDLSSMAIGEQQKERFVEYIVNLYRGGGWSVECRKGRDQRENYAWCKLIFS